MELVDEIHRRVAEGPNAPNLAYLILLSSLALAPWIAARVRVPSIVALLVFGLALGPHGFGVLASRTISLRALGDLGLLYAMITAILVLAWERRR